MNEHEQPAVWEQLADENTKQYQAFFDYCQMGVGRSLDKLCAQYASQKGAQDAPKPPTTNLSTLKSWSSKFDWVARVAAWDQHLRDIEQQAREAAQRQIIDRELEAYEAEYARWWQAFESTPYHEQDWVQETDDPQRPGQKMRVVVVNSNVTKQRTLLRWFKDLTDLGRRAVGLPDKITESKTEHSGTIETPGSNWKAFLDDLRRQNQALTDAAEAEGDDPPDWE